MRETKTLLAAKKMFASLVSQQNQLEHSLALLLMTDSGHPCGPEHGQIAIGGPLATFS